MSNSTITNNNFLEDWVSQKLDLAEVNKKLRLMGLDEVAITTHVKEFKRIRYLKRKFNAFLFMVLGGLIGLASCILTVTDVLPTMFDVFLYGLTTIAALLVFRGMYLLFEG